MKWVVKKFEHLTLKELYAIIKLRIDVFVVEQDCAYPELDNKDQSAVHVCGYISGQLITYARILITENSCSFGRLITSKDNRGKGLGHQLILQCEQYAREQLHINHFTLSAQEHLCNFYVQHGYTKISEPYNWDGIMHVDMDKKKA